MLLRHRARTLALVCASGVSLTSVPAQAATVRVLPRTGVLFVGTATEDGADAGAVSVRVGAGATSLVSLLGGHFHGDLCATDTPMFAGPGGIDPTNVTLNADGSFAGTQVSAAADGARVAGTLRGRFSASGTTASATLTYSLAPISGAKPCTVTATLALHQAPATPSGKVVPPRPLATYQAVTHQGWPATLVLAAKKATELSVGAWDVCHYTAVPAVHFLYPEHVRAQLAVAHGRFAVHLVSTGGSGKLDAAITGAFVGTGHHLAGALHLRRTGSIDGNAFTCDTQRVLFSAP